MDGEASTSFDLPTVPAFLLRVSALVRGFTPTDARDLANEMASMKLDEERSWIFVVIHEGEESSLRIRAYADDTDVIDLSSFGTRRLTSAIDREMSEFAAELGQ